MQTIKSFVDGLLELTGLAGTPLAIVRYVIMVLVVFLLAWLAGFFCRKVIVPLIQKLTSKTEIKWDEVLFNKRVLISACNIVPAVVVWQLLPLVFFESELTGKILGKLTAIYITVMTVRTLIVFIDSFKLLESGRRSSREQYFHTFCGVLKIIMIFFAVVAVVSIVLGKSPMTLIAGLGATSAVLMLVFKDTIEGLVAGIRLTSNEMLHKGDWITVPKASADGIVEEMTLTTVKVRNFDNTIITVSPKTLVEDSFQNWIGMEQAQGRRVKRKVYFDFNTIRFADEELRNSLVEKGYFKPEEMEEGVVNLALMRRYFERYIASVDAVNEQMTLMVRQLEPTNTGLPVEFYFFVKRKEWVNYEHTLAEIMDRVFAQASDFGLKIYQQYPLS